MQPVGIELLSEMEGKLTVIEQSESNPVKRAELSLNVINGYIDLLRAYVLKHRFRSPDEEIHFFKEVKPLFLSAQIYYLLIYNIEIKIPEGGEKPKRKYLQAELDKIKSFYDNNIEFYRYYRTGSAYLDHKYFVRGKHDIRLQIDTFFFETDPKFSTGYDYKISKIIAHDKLQVYLEEKLLKLQKTSIPAIYQDDTKMRLNWSESKAALVEVIYALYYQGAIENGKADLKDIASFFENIFNIDLGDYYRAFHQIRDRKSGRTKFLDNLRGILLQRMDEAEDF